MRGKYRYLQSVFTLLLVIVSTSFGGDWEQITELPIWRIGPAAAAVNGKVYLIGGYDIHENLGGRAPALSTVDVYDTQKNTWHAAANMPTPRIGAPTSVFSNEIYVFVDFDRKGPPGLSDKKRTLRCMTLQPIHGTRSGICQHSVMHS